MFIADRELMPILRAAFERGQRVRIVVNGRSMWPFIRDGDVVEIAPMPPQPAVGMAVLARLAPEHYPLHRLVARHGDTWVLRGDYNRGPDGLVCRQDLIGMVTRVERNGRIVRFVLGRTGRCIAWFSEHGWLVPLSRGTLLPLRMMQAGQRRLRRLAGVLWSHSGPHERRILLWVAQAGVACRAFGRRLRPPSA
jgi:hypothetical protein